MAQTQSPTNEGYGEFGKLGAGEAASAVKSVVCIKTSCTADESQTAAGITKSEDTGLDLVNADTVASAKTTVNNDTIQVDHKFTAAIGDTLKGFAVLNDDDDVVFMVCCFAADVVLAASDTLTVQAKMQFKKGS